MSNPIEIDYHDCQDFNLDFDETYPMVRFGVFEEKPSWVMYNVQPDTYRASVTEFRFRKEEELKEKITYEYPTPIAYYFHQTENGYNDNNHRLQLLRSTWEAIIFTLYSVVIGEARHKNFPLSQIAQVRQDGSRDLNFQDYYDDRLAQKLLILERILDFDQINGFGLSTSQIASVDVLRRIRDLNRARNGFMHTAALSDEQAGAKYFELFPEVLNVLRELTELENLQIIRFIQTASAITELRCETFNGQGITRHLQIFSVTNQQLGEISPILNSGNILALYQNDIFGIAPFLHFDLINSGNATLLCYFKRQRPGNMFEFEKVSTSDCFETDRNQFAVLNDQLRTLTT